MFRKKLLHENLRISNYLAQRFLKHSRNAEKAYYILLPEMPPDTPETNSLLRYKEYPDFMSLTPNNCITGCIKLAMEFDIEIGRLLSNLEKNHHSITFDELFNHIENKIVPLNYAWRTAKNMTYLLQNNEFRNSFFKINTRIENLKMQRWTNSYLHLALKRFLADNSKQLNPYQKSWIQYYLLEMSLNGIELTGDSKKVFEGFCAKHSQLTNLFRNKVNYCQNLFSHKIEDFSILSECPKNFLIQLSENKNDPSRGPWHITLNEQHYDTFMSYCSDHKTRWNVWNAYNNRASLNQADKNLSNHLVIEEIREMRYEMANKLGFKSYAEMVLKAQMAGHPESVFQFINQLKKRFQPLAEAELNELQEFAKSNNFKQKLAVWDIPYWARRQKQHLYNIDQDELKKYFSMNQVLKYLFGLSRLLFNINIQDHTCEVVTWNKDVKFYRIFDVTSQEELGSFYLDPIARTSDRFSISYMEPGRDLSAFHKILPFSYLILDIDPTNNDNMLMQFKDVQNLFFNFGHGLQQLLTQIPLSEISGQRNIQLDTLQTCAQLFLMILHHEQTLHLLGRHFQSREHLSQKMIDDILKYRKHFSSFNMMKQLYLSSLDMHVHTDIKTGCHFLMKKIWSDFMPIPLDPYDNHTCSFTPIFSGKFSSLYYSVKWSEMLAADIFKAFTEAGASNNEQLTKVGKKFRETYFSIGGAMGGEELFEAFRGRKPDLQHLISYYYNS